MRRQGMNRPLRGVRVLEAASVITGPFAGMLLVDLGAEVTKVELPGTGEIFRYWSESTGEVSPPFAAFNRAKESVTIDLRTAEGAECFARLAAESDVVIENFRPGVADRMGIGYQAIREVNSSVVYCSISGSGQSGPDSHRPTYDSVTQATSGLWSQLTDMSDPEPVGPALCDQLTGVYAALGVVSALRVRDQTGRSQYVSVSMLGVAIGFQASAVALQTMEGFENDKWSRAMRSQTFAVRAKDGLPLAIHLSTPEKFWRGMLEVIGRAELADDPRFVTKVDRIANYHELRHELAPSFSTRTRAEWLRLLRDRDVPSAPINTLSEALEDAQVQHLGVVENFGDEERPLRLAGLPIDFGPDVPRRPRPGPPAPGAHTDSHLRQVGYTDTEIAALRRRGVI